MSLRKYDKEWLEELCQDSYSYAEVLQKAGRKQGGGAQNTLKKKIEEFEIDISHFTGQGWIKSPNKQDRNIIVGERYNLEDIFIENSPVSQAVMRGYVQRHNLIEYKCQQCGCNGEWQNGFISLEIHHIDGNNKNNLLSNLQYLCPNCHALTDNFRNKRRE